MGPGIRTKEQNGRLTVAIGPRHTLLASFFFVNTLCCTWIKDTIRKRDHKQVNRGKHEGVIIYAVPYGQTSRFHAANEEVMAKN